MCHCNRIYSLPGEILREPGKGKSHAQALVKDILLKCLYVKYHVISASTMVLLNTVTLYMHEGYVSRVVA